MHFKLALFMTVFVTVFSQTFSLFTNSLGGVVKDEARKIISSVEGDVRRMQIKNPFSSMLVRGQPSGYMPKVEKNDKLQGPFNWTSCGPSKQVIEIKSLIVKPSPLSFPGTLTFAFDIVFHDNIDKADNVTVDVQLSFLARTTWVKLPCLGNIGSCTYKDLCSLLSPLSCPPDITKQGVKCNCPFLKGEYKIQPYTVEVDAAVFINGKYKAVINATSKNKGTVGCFKLAFEIE